MAYPLQHLQTQVEVYRLLGPSSEKFKKVTCQIKSELAHKSKRKLDLRLGNPTLKMEWLNDCSELRSKHTKITYGCKGKLPL